MKIKKGDTVKVITGKDRGKTGKVKVVLRKSNRIVVEGVNKLKKHRKAQGDTKPAGIYEFDAPIDVSNVMLVDPKDNKKTTRVGYVIDEKGNKSRIAKKSETKIN